MDMCKRCSKNETCETIPDCNRFVAKSCKNCQGRISGCLNPKVNVCPGWYLEIKNKEEVVMDYEILKDEIIDINELLADINDLNVIGIILKEHREDHVGAFSATTVFFRNIIKNSDELRDYFVEKGFIRERKDVCPWCKGVHSFLKWDGYIVVSDGVVDECPFTCMKFDTIERAKEAYEAICNLKKE